MSENGVRPQGGAGVTSQAAAEDHDAAAAPTATKLTTAAAEKPEANKPESVPVLQELYRDEHRGEFAVDLGDAPPPEPPPEIGDE